MAWITERKNVLSGVFYLAALWSYLRFEQLDAPGEVDSARRRNWRWYGLSLVLFLCALLSKTVTCSLPAAILLLLWWKRDHLTPRCALPLVPLFLLGGAMALVTAWMEKHNVHAQGPDWAFSFMERGLIAGRAFWFYLWKLLYPAKLTFNYPRWQIDAAAWWQYLFPVAAVALVAALWMLRKSVGKGPLVAMLFFAGTLLPALGFINTYPMRYSFVADHFQYLACIGPLVLCTALLRAAWGHRSARGLVGVALIILALLTWQQGHIYRDRETIWRDTLEKNPASFLAHCNLGNLLLDQGRTHEAAEHLTEAVHLKANFHEAHCSLGKALTESGRTAEAEAHYREAVRLRPDFAGAYYSLGTALAAQGRLDEAISNYQRALSLAPAHVDVHHNLANALVRQGKTALAIEHYRAALQLAPNQARVHHHLGNALSESEQYERAAQHYREAIRLRPSYAIAHRNLGVALARLGRTDEALRAYWLALRHDPLDTTAHFHLGVLLEMRGQLEGAITEYNATLKLDPGHQRARQALERLLSQ